MKTIIRVSVVVLLIMLALPVLPAIAQGEGGEVSGSSAVYYLSAESGSLAAVDGDTYTLTLNNVSPTMVWLSEAPLLQSYRLTTERIISTWTSANSLQADASLETEELLVSLQLSAPIYDAAASSLVFTAVVGDVRALGDVKAELPGEFGVVDLTIRWTEDFQDGLIGGILTMYEGMRALPTNCADGIVMWQQCRSDPAYKQANWVDCGNVAYWLDKHHCP